MTDHKKTRSPATVTRRTETQLDGLTPLEEKALRMLHGLSEGDEHELKFALGANEEAELKLAMMEKHLLDAFQWGELATFDISDEHVSAKARIIDRLRDDK